MMDFKQTLNLKLAPLENNKFLILCLFKGLIIYLYIRCRRLKENTTVLRSLINDLYSTRL